MYFSPRGYTPPSNLLPCGCLILELRAATDLFPRRGWALFAAPFGNPLIRVAELDPVDEAPSPELLCCPDSSKVTEARVLDELLPAAPLFFLSLCPCARAAPTLPPPFLEILGAGSAASPSGMVTSSHDQALLQSFACHLAALGCTLEAQCLVSYHSGSSRCSHSSCASISQGCSYHFGACCQPPKPGPSGCTPLPRAAYYC